MNDLRVSLLAAWLAAGIPAACIAQDAGSEPQAEGALEADNAQPQPANPAVDTKTLNDILNRIGKLKREVDQYREQGSPQGNVPANAAEQRIAPALGAMQLGASYRGQGRYFAARLILVHLTGKPVSLKREDITLIADGDTVKLGDTPSYPHPQITIGEQNYALRDLQTPNVLQLASGGTASTWLFFGGIPKGGNNLKLVLKMNFGDRTAELDVNQVAAQMLGLEVQRIGPHDSLALLTISGTMNTVNVGTLAETLEGLAAQKVSRCVIRINGAAKKFDNGLRAWLYQAAAANPGGQNEQLPALPSIRELHLCGLPSMGPPDRSPEMRDRNFFSRPDGEQRGARSRNVHQTDAEAVDAALASAFEILPEDELLREIRQGHRLSRAAALAHGGGRLGSDKLPMIMEFTDDKDPLMQKAALAALRHFGEPAAVDKLIEHARKNAEPLSETAIESLAASRFAAAHDALLKLLENEDPKSKISIVRILARNPRPIWSETIYRYCQDPRFGLNAEALRALVQVGHPKLVELLEEALKGDDRSLSEEAFGQLAFRTDSRSEAIAMDYMLSHLESNPPTPQMLGLLTRTKDARAMPLLLKQLSTSSTNRWQLIGVLSDIGDQQVSEVLAENYSSFRPQEQAKTLNALLKLNSPRFHSLASQALLTNDSGLISAACEGLQREGDPEAVRLLAEALEKSTNSMGINNICNTLSTLATPDAQAALRKAAESGDPNKYRFARSALVNLRQRSPGMQYVYHAHSFEQQRKWKQAVEQYDVAIKIDPELPEAYAGRGNAFLLQEEPQKAGDDFKKALHLDPQSSVAISGMAIVLVLEGKLDEGIASLEAARGKFANDPRARALFAYNSACVYARALEKLSKNENAEKRDEKMKEYRDKALAELRQSVKGGLHNFDWIRADPDLQPLKDLQEFKDIHSPGGKEKHDDEDDDGVLEVAPPIPDTDATGGDDQAP